MQKILLAHTHISIQMLCLQDPRYITETQFIFNRKNKQLSPLQLQCFKQQRCRIIDFSEIATYFGNKKPLPDKTDFQTHILCFCPDCDFSQNKTALINGQILQNLLQDFCHKNGKK